MSEQRMSRQELVEYSQTHDLLAKRLHVVPSEPADGLGPITEVLDEHVRFRTESEVDGVMFAAGPLAGEELQEWPGEGLQEGPGEDLQEWPGEGLQEWPDEGLFTDRAESTEETVRIAEADPVHSGGARAFTVREWMLDEGSYTIQVLHSAGKPRIA